jgi:hypothetical protein
MPRILQIREPDGSLSPYRERKIAESIRRALSDAGSDDRDLAAELAGVVSLFLERSHPDAASPPRICDVQDVTERVLRETGHDAAARCFRKTRAEREKLRERIVVRNTARRASEDVSAGGEAASETSRWSRTRLARSLGETFELPASVAEEVASAVERKVFALDLESVTADLIRHLVGCELFDRGLETAGRAGEQVPIPLRALTGSVFSPEPAPRAPGDSIAAAVLEHVALAEVHTPAVAAAHAEGLVHVHGLDSFLAVERLALPWDLATRLPPSSGARALLALRRTLDALRPHVAGAIELPDAAERLLAGAAAPAEAADELFEAVTACDAYDRARGPAIEIAVPIGSVPAEAARRLSARVLAADSGAVRVRFTRGPQAAASDAEALEAAAALLRASPLTSMDLLRDGDPVDPPGVLRFSLARVTLNLPLLLLSAGGEGVKEALSGLDRGAQIALQVFRERAWMQRKGPAFGLPAVIAATGGPGRVLVPASGQEVDLEIWGLAHALELLVRRGVVPRAAVPEAAARILGHLLYHLEEEQDGIRFHVRTGGAPSRAVRRRMLLACEAHARRFAAGDVLAELSNERAAEGVLPLAIPLSDRRNRALLSCSAVERLGLGLGLAEACLPGGISAEGLAELAASSRIRRFTLAPPGLGAPFEVQEEMFA